MHNWTFSIGTRPKIIEAPECSFGGPKGAEFALTCEWPDGEETTEYVTRYGAQALGFDINDAVIDLAAPARHGEAEAAAGVDLGGVEALREIERCIDTAISEAHTSGQFDQPLDIGFAQHWASKAMEVVRALVTSAGDAAKLVDAYRDAVSTRAVKDAMGRPYAKAKQNDEAEAAARLALDAHLAAKDRRSGAAGDGVREAVPAELRRLSEAAFKGDLRPGPFKTDLLSDNPKGGDVKLFDVRGWGFYTGKGHGALGLSETEAQAKQDANADFAAAAWNYARSRISAEDRARGAQGREDR